MILFKTTPHILAMEAFFGKEEYHGNAPYLDHAYGEKMMAVVNRLVPLPVFPTPIAGDITSILKLTVEHGYQDDVNATPFVRRNLRVRPAATASEHGSLKAWASRTLNEWEKAGFPEEFPK